MNPKLTLLVLVIAGLSSCSTVYKIQQTPDDVYYSPAPVQDEYVQTSSTEDPNVYYGTTTEDHEILRVIHSRRWRRLHQYDYDYPYGYGYYPYGNVYPAYVNPKTGNPSATYTAPRKYDLGAYPKNPAYTLDSRTGKIITAPNTSTLTSGGAPVRTFAKPNNGTGVGNFIRKVFSTPSTDYNTTIRDNTTTQSRTFEPSRNSSSSNSSSSASSSRSSSGSSGGNAPVRTFSK